MKLRKAVFLDRDGVLNRAVVKDGRPFPPATVDDLVLLPGVETACSALRATGFHLVLVTNQPDIARGKQTRQAVDQMNGRLQQVLGLDAVKVCPHDDADNCACRKPKPGLLVEAAGELAIDLRGSFMVGDRWRDIEAGRLAGCTTVWLDCKYDERPADGPDFTVPSLRMAARWILQRERTEE